MLESALTLSLAPSISPGRNNFCIESGFQSLYFLLACATVLQYFEYPSSKTIQDLLEPLGDFDGPGSLQFIIM